MAWEDRPLTIAMKNVIKLVKRSSAEYNPRRPDTESDIMDSMLGPLLPVYLTCIPNQVTSVKQLMKAPERITQLVRDPAHRPTILKYLLWRKHNWAILDAHGVPRQQLPSGTLRAATQVYADAEELAAMAECHSECVQLLKEFTGSIASHKTIRAVDIAGGDGRLAVSEVFLPYQRVDLID